MTGTAVVTGIGAVSPHGLGLDDFWSATRRGRSGIRRVTRFDPEQYPARLAGEVPGYDPHDHLPGRLIPATDRMTQLALLAAEQAFADSGLEPSSMPEFSLGVVTASSCGGFEFGERELRNLWSKGGQYVSAYQSFAWFYAVNTGQISIRHGLRGPGSVVVSDQAGGLDAIAQARRQIRDGAQAIVSGGVDASICPWGWVGQLASKRLSTSTDPRRAYLPFDARAGGHVPGEGGALLIIEEAASARERGAARIYGTIAGYAATFDPRPGSGEPPGLAKAIELALGDAGLEPGDVDVVFADAAGLLELDRSEAAAIRQVFGPCAVAVTAPKTMTGRLCSGAASLDLAAAFLAMRDGWIPPTVNVSPDPAYEIDLVTEPRRTGVSTALVLARGYGGFNSAVAVRAAG